MKSISTILSILSLLLIGVLFYLLFKHTDELKQISAREKKTSANDFRIAYFDMDTLYAHYAYYKDAQAEAKTKENEMNAELSDMEKKYQKKIVEWQKKGNTMTPAENEQAQQEYSLMQQTFQNRKEALQQELFKSTEEKRNSLRKLIEDYVKEYNKQRNYSFIFAYDPSSFIYYRDTVYNITSDLLDGLNQAYKSKH
ncbi:MAG: OmpH family outer membrane protein [Bacteroidota bacterium]|nr:OmpH family outer membrane protein [Bacteroidota bacterium]MDP4216454.1 OmpH family outer membrane protein [Bacteroidota bacterium]MDP4247686.1 OmpH family outer membrane protein [Bacteroidota bacterium]MDP4252418.1 OmpH family outer membrane protein [Bacteroidota bacterium]MDP4258596.1 OmpH family outer membrane protein [Bacteroidota bacterium]